MTARRAKILLAATLFTVPGALAQAQAPEQSRDDGPATAAIAPANVPAPRKASAGVCTILKGDQVVEQQNCKALADTADASGAGFAKGITYVWPSGNRTIVGGTEDDFSVNGNLAVPLPDSNRGLCLKVDKTGNTFCFKDGAKVKTAAAQPAATPPAAASTAAPTPPKPAEAKRSETGTAVAGATITAPAATATTPPLADQLAEEVKLRKAAEEELKILKAEIARLNEVEEKRLAELAAQTRAAEAEAKKKAEEEKSRAGDAAQEIEALTNRCIASDAAACERAIVLAKDHVKNGAISEEQIQELELLRDAALQPPSGLASVPRSTWAMSSIAAFLALALVALAMRRNEQSQIRRHAAREEAGLPVPQPTLDSPPAPKTQAPSLDPFAALPPLPDPIAAVTLDPAPARNTPPPIPAYAAMPVLFPPKV